MRNGAGKTRGREEELKEKGKMRRREEEEKKE